MSRPGIDRVFERRLSALFNGGQPQILQGGAKGVEKESLRVRPDGTLLSYQPYGQEGLLIADIDTGLGTGLLAARASI